MTCEYDRRVACVRELENEVARFVKEEFALLHEMVPDEIHEIADPWIGVSFDPHEPRQAVGLRNIVIRALAAQAWAGQQRPDLPPLPLQVEEIKEMKASPDPELVLWAKYAEGFRDNSWDVQKWWWTFDKFRREMRRAGLG